MIVGNLELFENYLGMFKKLLEIKKTLLDVTVLRTIVSTPRMDDVVRFY